MGTTINFVGTDYTIPAVGEVGWGLDVTNYLLAISTSVLTRGGGQFTLTSNVNFGPTFGLETAFIQSRQSNPATAGIARLANSDSIQWRNAGNSDNLVLDVNSSSNRLEFQGSALIDASSSQTLFNKTLSSANLLNPTITGGTISGLTVSSLTGLDVDGNTQLGNSSGDTLTVDATSTFNAPVTLGSTLQVSGASTFNSDLTLNGELLNAQLQNLSSNPSSGSIGRIWLNTTDDRIAFDSDGTNIYYLTDSRVVTYDGSGVTLTRGGTNLFSTNNTGFHSFIPNGNVATLSVIQGQDDAMVVQANAQSSKIRFFGSSHASTPSQTDFLVNNTINGSISSGGAWVIGNLANSSSHSILGDLNLSGELTVSSNATFNGTTTFNGNVVLDGTLQISSALTLNDDLTVNGNTILDGTLTVSSTSTLNGALTLTDTLTVQGNGSTTGLSVNSSNAVTLGASGGTQTHTVNGNLSVRDGTPAERILLDSTNVTVDFPTSNGFINSVGSVYINVDSNNNDTSSVFEVGTNRTGSTGGETRFGISAAGAATIGASGGTQTHTVNGNALVLDRATAADTFNLGREASTGAINITGDNAASFPTSGGRILLYGSSNASNDNEVHIISGGTTTFVADAGAATIGASGSTAQHEINGARARIFQGSNGASALVNSASILALESDIGGFVQFLGPTNGFQGFFFNEGADNDGAQFRYQWTGTASTSEYEWRAAAAQVMRLGADGAFTVGAGTTKLSISASGLFTVGVANTSQHTLNTATATSATAGSNGDVPAQVDGYITITINGATKKIPYYAN